MKRILITFLLCLFLLSGCQRPEATADIAATTLPVWEFTTYLCQGTPLRVERLITENVSCLHDYSLNVRQVRAAEQAQVIVLSGAGLEDGLFSFADSGKLVDASIGIHLLCPTEDAGHDHAHHHKYDPHYWLSPELAKGMAENIRDGLAEHYPEYQALFSANFTKLLEELDRLQEYGQETLSPLSCRELITFHDGFAYFAAAFDLTVLEAVEEESGSEASAQELKHLITLVQAHRLSAVFTEENSSASAADVIARETGAAVFSLDMAMSGDSYFTAMYHNIDTIKEALE